MPDEKLEKIDVTVACRTVDENASPGFARRSWAGAGPQLAALSHRTRDAGYALDKPTDAIGLQAWLDVPLSVDAGVHDTDVAARAEDVSRALVAIATARHPLHDDVLRRELDDWLEWLRRVPVADGGAFDALELPQAGHDDDLVVRTNRLGPVFVYARSRGADGPCPGVLLRFAVGPDRFGLRIEGRPTVRAKGIVPAPNDQMTFGTYEVLNRLTDAVDALAEQATAYERRVHEHHAETDAAAVREHLVTHSHLFAAHSRLAGRRAAFTRRLERLSASGRERAVAAPDKDLDRLATLAQRLEEASGRINDASEYLATTSSLELAHQTKGQADRSEFLARLAAAFVPPTLVVGALGANVLPWEDTGSWEPLTGMLLLMIGTGLGTNVVVGALQDRRKRTSAWTIGLALVALAVSGLGLWWLLDGTTARGLPAPEVVVHEHVVTVPQLLPPDVPGR
jgi:hypothetical protein